MKLRPSDWVLPALRLPAPLAASLALPVGAGAGAWALAHPDRVDDYVKNALEPAERWDMLAWIGVVALSLVGLSGLVAAWRQQRGGRWDLLGSAAWTTRALFGFAALLPLGYASASSLSPKLVFVVAAVSALVAALWLGLLPGVRGDAGAVGTERPPVVPAAPPPPAGSRALAFACFGGVLALWAVYAWLFSTLAITNHQALNTRTTDLGLYDNIFWQSIHGRPLACTFIRAGYHGSAHFDPILVILSPLYLLHPRAEFLLVLQSAWLGATVVPLYLLATRVLHSPLAALTLALVFVLYPALHGATLYEFHSLVLVTPLLVWLLYAFEIGSSRGYWIAFAVLLLVREDVALLLCFVGAYVALTRRPGALLQGAITIGASLVYFAIVKTFFMTSAALFMSGKDSYSFAYYYDALIPKGMGLKGLMLSLVTNPIFALGHVISEDKITFLGLVFGPIVFVPFFAHPGRVMLLYGLVFCLLASRRPVYSIHFQYTTILFPIAFALVPAGLRALAGRWPEPARGRFVAAALAAMLAASLVLSWNFGALVENGSFRAGFYRVTRALDDSQRETYAWVREMVEQIPKDASVAATPRLGPHISNRSKAYNLRGQPKTDYVFLNERELDKDQRKMLKEIVKRGLYVRVDRRDSKILLRRVE